MKRIIIIIYSCLWLQAGFGQYAVDSVLASVAKNNKSIPTYEKFAQAKATIVKTGLTPYDPQVEYDYMAGTPLNAGNQRDFSITQRIDFPTTYQRKKALANLQIGMSELEQKVYRQEVLLEAKLQALKIIYLNRRGAELSRRLQNTEKLVRDFMKKLDQGEVIILDINKAKLQLLTIRQEFSLNQNAIAVATTKLVELNGGIPIEVKDTVYPLAAEVPDFDRLDSLIEANDPVLRVYEQEKRIWEGEIRTQIAMNWPKLEAGYHSQGILGQRYRGVHVGFSLPLWENKNKLKAKQLSLGYATANAQQHKLGHHLANKGLYEQLAIRQRSMEEYKALLSTLNNQELLDKALRLGQITVIQYFYDMSFYNAAYDSFLQMELEYQEAMARLYRFAL